MHSFFSDHVGVFMIVFVAAVLVVPVLSRIFMSERVLSLDMCANLLVHEAIALRSSKPLHLRDIGESSQEVHNPAIP